MVTRFLFCESKEKKRRLVFFVLLSKTYFALNREKKKKKLHRTKQIKCKLSPEEIVKNPGWSRGINKIEQRESCGNGVLILFLKFVIRMTLNAAAVAAAIKMHASSYILERDRERKKNVIKNWDTICIACRLAILFPTIWREFKLFKNHVHMKTARCGLIWKCTHTRLYSKGARLQWQKCRLLKNWFASMLQS